MENEQKSAGARAVLRRRDFRIVFWGAFAPHIGTWMRHIVLIAYAYDISGSATFVGLLTFVYLAPVILLGIPAGLLLDRFDRRKLLIAGFVVQGALSAALAAVAAGGGSRTWLVVVTSGLGVCNAVFLPAYTALVPSLVDRPQLHAAISLMSTQQNATRVIGPVLAGAGLAVLSPAQIFLVSAGLALVAIPTLVAVHPAPVVVERGTRLGAALLGGIRAGRENRIIGRTLIGVTVFSFVCLFFVNQLPVVAEQNLALDATSPGYGVFYAAFGLGAVAGAMATGPLLARLSLATTVRGGLLAFAVSLTAFALVRDPWSGAALIFVVGVAYLAVMTALTAAVQVEAAEHERGRVSTLWSMAYAGSVGVSNLALGPFADAWGPTPVLLLGAVVALPLAWYLDMRPGRR